MTMGINLVTAAAVSLLVSFNCQVIGSLIDEFTYDNSFIADILKVGSFICLIATVQLGLLGLILILVS